MFLFINGWQPASNNNLGDRVEKELSRELSRNPKHILAGRPFSAVAANDGSDDILIHLDGDEFALVHLTWNLETNPQWPTCEILRGIPAVNRLIIEWEI